MIRKWQADIEINEAQVRKCLEVQFPALLLRKVCFLGEGWDNRVFLVNQSIIFRFPRRRVAGELINRENHILKQLAHFFSLQIPTPLFEGKPTQDYPYSFQGYPCIKGASVGEATLTEKALLNSLKPLALFLKQLHFFDENQALMMGAKSQLFDKTEKGRIIALLRDRAEQLILLGYPIDKKQIQAEIDGIRSIRLSDVRCLVHGDLYFKHLIFHQERLKGIIDWGDVGINHPVVDLAIIWGLYPKKYHAHFFDIYRPVDSNIWQYARFLAIYMAITLILYGLDINEKQLVSEASASIQRINYKLIKN
ncbi:phosphotransferase [Rickettsiella endosymbiont of Dermanyssus gallinae]|uniref:phosphotransferase n=1 Tax=Rickettsiella endosymbiont of Dermanyssus gallinae TaxID=2856608 RepID=UPI001C52C5AF|nr:phosphotransferase [Rickettsiella endosymbiont of Dermanyssus gallinae]